jgi:hypothetical protein
MFSQDSSALTFGDINTHAYIWNMSWRTPWSHTQPTVGQFSTHIIASYALANGLHQRESKLKIIGDLKT